MINDTRHQFMKIMLRIRAFEERVYKMYSEGHLYGIAPHLSCGEEAMAAGVCAVLGKDDYVVSTHRGHGHCLAKGAKMRPMMAELCGKETGYCKGRGGSMHIASTELGILGANGIVGAGLPIACGAGFSIKYKNTDQVCVCFFGDAASNQGTFHESINFACAFKLPVVFVCENNLYGLSTSYAKVSATPDVADRAQGYKMPGMIVNGMDVIEVYHEAKEAVARAKNGEGPTLIEGRTYRYHGHNITDRRFLYRSHTEEEEWKKKRDPIQLLKNKMLKDKAITEKDYLRLEAEAEVEADDAAEYALACPDPDVKDVLQNVYT